jgi:hypothetical protein
MLCGLGGILSCGITHTMVTPLDLVKCRIQVNPEKYKSVVNGFRVSKHTYLFAIFKTLDRLLLLITLFVGNTC